MSAGRPQAHENDVERQLGKTIVLVNNKEKMTLHLWPWMNFSLQVQLRPLSPHSCNSDGVSFFTRTFISGLGSKGWDKD